MIRSGSGIQRQMNLKCTLHIARTFHGGESGVTPQVLHTSLFTMAVGLLNGPNRLYLSLGIFKIHRKRADGRSTVVSVKSEILRKREARLHLIDGGTSGVSTHALRDASSVVLRKHCRLRLTDSRCFIIMPAGNNAKSYQRRELTMPLQQRACFSIGRAGACFFILKSNKQDHCTISLQSLPYLL